MQTPHVPPSATSEITRPNRLRLFQQWELSICNNIAKKSEKEFKYPLYRLSDNGRWMYVVCADDTELPFTKTQMNQYRAAEEWVEKGGHCPIELQKQSVAGSKPGVTTVDENPPEEGGVKV